MLRVAVIGAGSIARKKHIPNLLSMGCEVHVLDPFAEALINLPEGAIPFHLGPNSGVAPTDYDAIVVASPLGSHLGWAKMAIGTGIPLFLEKPVGHIAELSEWRRLADRAADLTTQTGYQLRFHPILRMMREQFKEPTSGGFYCDVNMSTWPGQSYGPWLLEISHELDAALACGAPTDVAQVDRIDATSANIWLGGEERWLVSLDADADRYYRSWRLAQGQSTIDVQFHAADALGSLMYYDEMLHFIECVREGRQTDCPLSDGVRVLEVCAQIEQMARKAA